MANCYRINFYCFYCAKYKRMDNIKYGKICKYDKTFNHPFRRAKFQYSFPHLLEFHLKKFYLKT